MTTTLPWREALSGASATATPGERRLYVLSALLVLSGLVHLVVQVATGTTWLGPVSFRKPATFGLAFGLDLAVVTWTATYLRLPPRLRTLLLVVLAVDSVVEVAGITLQAWRGVPSHVNRETAFDSAVSTVLAIGGGVLVLTLVTCSVFAFRPKPGTDAPMRLALLVGYLSLCVGLVSGALMIARGVALANSGHQQEAYQRLSYLKLLHGVSLNGIVLLPPSAWLLSLTSWGRHRRLAMLAVVVTGYVVLLLAAAVVSFAG